MEIDLSPANPFLRLGRAQPLPAGQALRKVPAAPYPDGAAESRRHPPASPAPRARDLAPLVAIVGCDGSGKSSVAAGLLEWMQARGDTRLCHLGKQTGNIGRAIARWPLVGGRLDKAISTKAKSANKARGPDALTALAIYLFSMRRVRRFRRMLAIRGHGTAILADRFPQVSVPGPMDGLGLGAARARNGFVAALARRERRHYEWMARHRPDLVIRLNVDFATALARKPDHRPSSLQKKIADVPLLSFDGAPIVDIDATQPFAIVLEQAKRAVATALGDC